MQNPKKLSRSVLILAVVGIVFAALILLMMPKPIAVDLGSVERRDLEIMIVEEGRTNVRETYIVSTPVAGRLLRVQVHPGDEVRKDEGIVARMLPTNPAVLDRRTREQAAAAVEAAAAAVRLARANLDAALAQEELTRSELERTRSLFESKIVSQAALDRAESARRASRAARETAEAAITMREAELVNAQANFVGQDDVGLANAIADNSGQETLLRSPIDGRILRVFQESETVLPAGAPIMEIGDTTADLEVVVDLISSDAVKVSIGDPVVLRDWGQDNELIGQVRQIDPFGITKTSALGIEEQRVRVEIDLKSRPDERLGLGHGYRLEAAIVIWSGNGLVVVPTSALFRSNGSWSVFRETNGTAESTPVKIGRSDGALTEVLGGLVLGDRVVLYPSAAVENGVRIESRF